MAATRVSVYELLEIIGDSATSALLDQRAGVTVYVPKAVGGVMADIIGPEALAKLCAAMGGCFVVVPEQRRLKRDVILDSLRSGASIAQAAKYSGSCERYVYMLKASPARDIS